MELASVILVMFSGVMHRNSLISSSQVRGLRSLDMESWSPLNMQSPCSSTAPLARVAAPGKINPGEANKIPVQLKSSLIFWFLQEKKQKLCLISKQCHHWEGSGRILWSLHLPYMDWRPPALPAQLLVLPVPDSWGIPAQWPIKTHSHTPINIYWGNFHPSE